MIPKIFGIGLYKTGTTSLHVALEILGYNSVHCPVTGEEFDGYDAANDITVASRFEEWDKLYPGSKFILTLRDLNQWLGSCKDHFGRRFNPNKFSPKVREFYLEQILKTYGTAVYDPVLLQEAYQRHIQHVQNYFAHRPQDLLIMNIPNGDGWDRFSPFLKHSIPNQPFPHENVANEPNLDVMRQNQNRIANLLEQRLENCLN